MRFSIKRLLSMSKNPIGRLNFFLISDFGCINHRTKQLAQAMDRYASETLGSLGAELDFIVGLGDNFYPYGVEDIDDVQFKDTWRDQFLIHRSLRVPWRMVLGNHDYMGNPTAQIDYHYSDKFNADKLWCMPDNCYKFSYRLDFETLVDLFVLDSNACQGHVFHSYPHADENLRSHINDLGESLYESSAKWKLVFAHHPMYTKGLGHSAPAKRLRESPEDYPSGYGLEKTIKGKVDAYFAGHEHVFQHHEAHGLHHFCCGASGAEQRPGNGLYKGENRNQSIDWVANPDQTGFLAVEIISNVMIVKFVDTEGKTIYEVVINKQAG